MVQPGARRSSDAPSTIRGGARRLRQPPPPVEGHGTTVDKSLSPSTAAHLVHVRLDRRAARSRRCGRRPQDVGRALNPALDDGPDAGRAAQGLGWALYERLVHDRGPAAQGWLIDYTLPRAEHIPEDDPHRRGALADGPFGANGIGEADVLSAPAAVAMRAAGGPRMRELPMTAPRVWRAMHEGNGSG